MQELKVIQHNDQRILLTSQIAEAYETTTDVIKKNFANNKARYLQGKHYYYLEGDELKAFKNEVKNLDLVGKNASSLYLWTEKGAFLHAKSLNTDKAWEVYDILVDTYFNVKEAQKKMCLEDILIAQLQDMKAVKEQLNKVNSNALEAKETAEKANQQINTVKEAMLLDHDSWRKDCNNILNKIAKEQRGGTKEAYKEVRNEAYSLVEQRAGANLKQRVTNKQDRMRREGLQKSKVDKISQIDVIAEDRRLKEIYIAVIKEMAIKYGVK